MNYLPYLGVSNPAINSHFENQKNCRSVLVATFQLYSGFDALSLQEIDLLYKLIRYSRSAAG